MIIVAGTFKVDPAERDEFIRGREEMMRSSRAEDGCLDYAFMPDPIEPDIVRLFERWESTDALAAHIAAMRSSGGQRSSGGPRPLETSIQQYKISAVGPVGGELTPL